jgi:hypothetical protein
MVHDIAPPTRDPDRVLVIGSPENECCWVFEVKMIDIMWCVSAVLKIIFLTYVLTCSDQNFKLTSVRRSIPPLVRLGRCGRTGSTNTIEKTRATFYLLSLSKSISRKYVQTDSLSVHHPPVTLASYARTPSKLRRHQIIVSFFSAAGS